MRALTQGGAKCERSVVQILEAVGLLRRNDSNVGGEEGAAPPHILSGRRGTSCLLAKALRSGRRSLGGGQGGRWGGVLRKGGGRVGGTLFAAGGSQCLIPGNSRKLMHRQRLERKLSGSKVLRSGFAFIRAAAQGAAVMSHSGRRLSAC